MLNLLKKLTVRTLSFTGSMIFLVSLGTYLLINGSVFNPYYFIRIFGLVALYVILALVTKDLRGIDEMFSEVWTITQQEGISCAEKMDIIKAYLDSAVAQWHSYWVKYQDMVNGGSGKPSGKWRLFKYHMVQISKGEINLYQIIWIFIYTSYSILASVSFFALQAPFDIIISLGILLAVLLSGGQIVGISKTMIEMFKLLKCQEDETGASLEMRLRTIERLIMRASKNYYFLTIKEDIYKKKFICGGENDNE